MQLAIGICHRALGYARAYLDLGTAVSQLGFAVTVLDYESSDLPMQRNRVVQKALDVRAEALLFVDDDQLVTADLIRRLVRHRQPVIGSTIMTRSFTQSHIAAYSLDPKDDGSPWFRSIMPELIDATTELIPVDAVGMGCTVLDLRAVCEVTPPWFETTRCADGSIIGEDLHFCLRMKQAGFAVYLDPTVRVPHLITGALIPLPHGEAAFVEPTEAVARAEAAMREEAHARP